MFKNVKPVQRCQVPPPLQLLPLKYNINVLLIYYDKTKIIKYYTN